MHFNRKSTVCAFVLLIVLLGNSNTPAFAFWGLLGKLGGVAGKAGGAVGKTAAGTVGKGAAVGAGVEGAAASGLLDDAARGASKLGATETAAVTANAALPPEVARYLAKPVHTLTAADTADMMVNYQKIITNAGKTGDYTTLERLPNMTNQGKTLTNAEAKASTAAPPTNASVAKMAPAKSFEIPSHAIHLLVHASKAGNHSANTELKQRCATFRKQGNISKSWQDACKM